MQCWPTTVTAFGPTQWFFLEPARESAPSNGLLYRRSPGSEWERVALPLPAGTLSDWVLSRGHVWALGDGDIWVWVTARNSGYRYTQLLFHSKMPERVCRLENASCVETDANAPFPARHDED